LTAEESAEFHRLAQSQTVEARLRERAHLLALPRGPTCPRDHGRPAP
jgi:hypothetical protein